MSDRLIRLRKRFGITPDREESARGIAVTLCALSMELIKTGAEEDYHDAIKIAVGMLPESTHNILRVDHILRNTVLILVSGMMDALTTEWHN